MSRGQKRGIFLLVGVLCAWAIPQAALALSAFESGKEEFKLKRFWAAKAKFMTAVQQEPANQKAYLYLGRCLEYLRETDDAQATYRACFSVNPFSEDGKRAKQFSIDISGRMEASEHRAVDDPQQVIDTGLLIQRQALDLQARKIREAESYYKNRRNVSRRSGYYYTTYDLANASRAGEISNQRFINNSSKIYDWQNEALKARLHGQRSAQSVQDSANALIERIGRKTGTSPALRALGTNLYTQYFRSKNEEEDIPPPPDPPIELRAKQLKFNDIPRAWRGQSKIFKFPTIGPDDFLAEKKPKTLDEALMTGDIAPMKKVVPASASRVVKESTEAQIKSLESKSTDASRLPATGSSTKYTDDFDDELMNDPTEAPIEQDAAASQKNSAPAAVQK